MKTFSEIVEEINASPLKRKTVGAEEKKAAQEKFPIPTMYVAVNVPPFSYNNITTGWRYLETPEDLAALKCGYINPDSSGWKRSFPAEDYPLWVLFVETDPRHPGYGKILRPTEVANEYRDFADRLETYYNHPILDQIKL